VTSAENTSIYSPKVLRPNHQLTNIEWNSLPENRPIIILPKSTNQLSTSRISLLPTNEASWVRHRLDMIQISNQLLKTIKILNQRQMEMETSKFKDQYTKAIKNSCYKKYSTQKTTQSIFRYHKHYTIDNAD